MASRGTSAGFFPTGPSLQGREEHGCGPGPQPPFLWEVLRTWGPTGVKGPGAPTHGTFLFVQNMWHT